MTETTTIYSYTPGDGIYKHKNKNAAGKNDLHIIFGSIFPPEVVNNIIYFLCPMLCLFGCGKRVHVRQIERFGEYRKLWIYECPPEKPHCLNGRHERHVYSLDHYQFILKTCSVCQKERVCMHCDTNLDIKLRDYLYMDMSNYDMRNLATKYLRSSASPKCFSCCLEDFGGMIP